MAVDTDTKLTKESVEDQTTLALTLARWVLGPDAGPASIEAQAIRFMNLGEEGLKETHREMLACDPVQHQECLTLSEVDQKTVLDCMAPGLSQREAQRELIRIDREVGLFEWEETYWRAAILERLLDALPATDFDSMEPHDTKMWEDKIEALARETLDKETHQRNVVLEAATRLARRDASNEFDKRMARETDNGWGTSPLADFPDDKREMYIRGAEAVAYQKTLEINNWDTPNNDWDGSPLGLYPDLDSLVKHHPWGERLAQALWWVHQSSYIAWSSAEHVKGALKEAQEESLFALELAVAGSVSLKELGEVADKALQQSIQELKILWQDSQSKSSSSTSTECSPAQTPADASAVGTP